MKIDEVIKLYELTKAMPSKVDICRAPAGALQISVGLVIVV